MALAIFEKDVDGIHVITLKGRVTLGEETKELRYRIKDALSKGKARLVLDLSNVDYIDSAGLGTLVASSTSAHSQGAQIKLASLTRQVNQILQITRLVTVFEVFDTLEAALRSYGQPS